MALTAFATGVQADPRGHGDSSEPDRTGASEILESCLSEARDQNAPAYPCIGRLSRPCLERTENQTTLGMERCFQVEGDGWDVLLNRYYRLRSNPDWRRAQRAWITYRDAKCAYWFVHYEGGSMARWLAAQCRMEETARRTFDLARFASEY
jgi:uncharacterized protein YecT (DUF1311 family)